MRDFFLLYTVVVVIDNAVHIILIWSKDVHGHMEDDAGPGEVLAADGAAPQAAAPAQKKLSFFPKKNSHTHTPRML